MSDRGNLHNETMGWLAHRAESPGRRRGISFVEMVFPLAHHAQPSRLASNPIFGGPRRQQATERFQAVYSLNPPDGRCA